MIFLHRQSREPYRFPADHRSESRLSIPQRGALQQSSSPLPQPSSIFIRTAQAVEKYSANGECLILCLSHIWGAPHSVKDSVFSPPIRNVRWPVFAPPRLVGVTVQLRTHKSSNKQPC